ncbi:MAG: hypothetical protein U0228_31730 [Myxococcaceae bacterium]
MLRRLSFAVCIVAALAACPKPPAPAFTPPSDTVFIPIEDRQWDDEAPKEGWCGETSIQMAALHFGQWVPQAEANRLGHPKTPDLWEYDVPVAMDALGLRYETGPRDQGIAKFVEWVVASLRQGRPVIVGFKNPPSTHPEWEVDHLVLAVGSSPAGLTVNTNMEDGQALLKWDGLFTADGSRSLSLVNRQGTTWGYAVKGFDERRQRGRVKVEGEETLVLEAADGTTLEVQRTGAVVKLPETR